MYEPNNLEPFVPVGPERRNTSNTVYDLYGLVGFRNARPARISRRQHDVSQVNKSTSAAKASLIWVIISLVVTPVWCSPEGFAHLH